MRKPFLLSENLVRDVCAALPVRVPTEALTPLTTYLQLLMRWNKVMNLVGARHWQECLTTLVVDSFHLAEFIENTSATPGAEGDSYHTWDLGAGAGLPGIPLRMVWDKGTYSLVEVREKRALFLSNVLAQIPLARTEVFRGRAEDFFLQKKAPADLVLSRAFLPWEQVLALVEGELQDQGRVIFLTLEPPVASAVTQLGWQVEAVHNYKVHKNTRFFWSARKGA